MVGGGIVGRPLDRPSRVSSPVDSAPQVAKLRAASGTRDSFNPAVRFQIVERQPELSSGLFSPEKRDFGVVLSPVNVNGFGHSSGPGLRRVESRKPCAYFMCVMRIVCIVCGGGARVA